MSCLTRPSTLGFQFAYGYQILESTDNEKARKKKHQENAILFLNLIPLVSIVANLVFVALQGGFQPKMRKMFWESLPKEAGGQAFLSRFIISGLGLGIFLLPAQLVATGLNWNSRYMNIEAQNKKLQEKTKQLQEQIKKLQEQNKQLQAQNKPITAT